MQHNILHATFARAEDGIQAVESLLYHGVRAEDISLILPRQQSAGAEQTIAPLEGGGFTASPPPGASGHIHDAPAPVPGKSPASAGRHRHEAILDTEEGAGLGLGFGLLTAMCIPGISLIDSSGTIAVGLMAAGTVAGGIAGGIYGYLVDRGVARGIASIMSHHLEGGGTTLSVTVPATWKEADIVRILQGFGGHIIPILPNGALTLKGDGDIETAAVGAP